MLMKIVFAGVLVVATVSIHAVGFSALLRTLVWSHALAMSGFWRVIRVVIGLTCWLVLIHVLEVVFWGAFYVWQGRVTQEALQNVVFTSGKFDPRY